MGKSIENNRAASEAMEDVSLTEAMLEDLSDAIRHGILVSRLASELAKTLGEEEPFVQDIAVAGMLHDIGKLRLTEYLYGRKADTLVVEEMKYVRMHSAYSRDILTGLGYKEEIGQIVYHHHENYDGSGYPDNLKGRAIPWGARLLRTCDVFAALTSKRPYRDAFDVDTAMELMIDEVKNFDMRVFLAFQSLIFSNEFTEIQELIHKTNVPDQRIDDWARYLIIQQKPIIMAHSLVR